MLLEFPRFVRPGYAIICYDFSSQLFELGVRQNIIKSGFDILPQYRLWLNNDDFGEIMHISEIKKCRICGNNQLITVIDLGNQALSGRFPKKNEPAIPSAPLVLIRCDNSKNPEACGLVQLKHSVPPDQLYKCDYGYRSGINRTMSDHLRDIVLKAQKKVKLEKDDIVLDIGCNDGTLLKSLCTQRH